MIPEVIDHAIQMVKGCSCEDGCPACVGDIHYSKKMVLWGLRSLKERLEAPEYVKKQVEEARPVFTNSIHSLNFRRNGTNSVRQ